MTYFNTLGASTRIDVFASLNLGAQTLTMKLPIAQFIDLSEIPNEGAVDSDEISQRNLDRAHASKLAVYVLKGLVNAARNYRKSENKDTRFHDEILLRLGEQSYFSLQPVVVNIPATLDDLNWKVQTNSAGDDVAVRISLPPTATMWVIDGQHRRWAMNLVLDFLRNVITFRAYPRKGSLFPAETGPISPGHLEVWREAQNLALQHCTVTIEAHLGLNAEAQRQLFHDLNNLGKSVSAGMAFDFDNSNPVNIFIKKDLIEGGGLSAPITEKDIVDWQSHDGSMARKDVVAVNSILFLNKTNPKAATPAHVDRMRDVALRFWTEVSNIKDFGAPGAKLKTVAAQPVVLKGLAKLAYDFAVGRKADDDHLETLLNGIDSIDFSHGNPMWRYYELSREERAKLVPGLSDYLPNDDGNRDLGGSDDGKMRFGAKHNDIYPIIGDMIRWKLGLPSRQEEQDDVLAA
ncbi:MAG TPA: DNA sulfur modification protein DndB [Caulobacteraceae bacterium]|nr:DNA sulfur modification protein DndB [Caulobacteraceae bacterium]